MQIRTGHDQCGRLAAIVATDVVGYSRLMEQDEAGALERLRQIPRSWSSPPSRAIADGSRS
jgi:class 3 adenylate cyclase